MKINISGILKNSLLFLVIFFPSTIIYYRLLPQYIFVGLGVHLFLLFSIIIGIWVAFCKWTSDLILKHIYFSFFLLWSLCLAVNGVAITWWGKTISCRIISKIPIVYHDVISLLNGSLVKFWIIAGLYLSCAIVIHYFLSKKIRINNIILKKREIR